MAGTKSYLQARAELSQFDDSVRRERLAQEQAAFERATQHAAPVPVTDNVVYDPAHPRADWAGLVSRDALPRAAFPDNAAHRQGVVRTERGIMPGEGAQTQDYYPAMGKKHFESDLRFASVEASRADPLIASCDAPAGPARSAYQSFAAADGTAADQLAPDHRGKGRKHVTPMHELSIQEVDKRRQAELRMQMMRCGDGGGSVRFAESENDHGGSLVGYRAPTFKHGSSSMLGGLGSKIGTSASVAQRSPAVGQAGLVPSYASSSDKSLRSENFVPPTTIPGYTGRRGR